MTNNEMWDELKYEASKVKILKESFDKKRVTLLGAGNKEADILFLGDDPSLFTSEDYQVEAGSSGEFFQKLCYHVNLNSNSFYLTNIVKTDLKLVDLEDEEAEEFKDILHMQISLIKPKYIVTLGISPLKFLLEKENLNIKDTRGQIFPWRGNIKILSLYDPNFLNKHHSKKKHDPKWQTWQDLKQFRATAEAEGLLNG